MASADRLKKTDIQSTGEQQVSPLVAKLYAGGWPDENEIRQLGEEQFFQRATQAYLLTLPALNIVGLRDGSERTFGRGFNILPIWKDRMNARTLVPTPNCDVIYAMSYLNLKESGPLVVYAPPAVMGMFTDFFQRTLTDVGAAGPDRGEGGLYLLLPPDHDGHIPQGYFAFRSKTYNVFLFFRALLTAGAGAPDTRRGVATLEQTRVYPLHRRERDRPRMSFPNGSRTPVSMMYPTDFSYWEKLKTWIDEEPVESLDPEARGILASIGIIKNAPFNPDSGKRAILERAVDTAARMIFASRVSPEEYARAHYYTDRQYICAWSGVDADFFGPSYLSVDARSTYFQLAYSSAPAMAVDSVNVGSKYPATYRDANGELLSGSRSYKLRLPCHIPARLYWAVTIYNPADGTMPQTAQAFPSRNEFDALEINRDGSVEVYFGPSKPAIAPEKNWIQTLPDRAFFVAIRLYGTEITFYDQSWKPDDIEPLDWSPRLVEKPRTE